MRHPLLTARSAAQALLLSLAFLVTGVPAAAQDRADFLFDRPVVRLSLSGGLDVPRARSQIFDFTTRRLTVDDADLRSVAVAGGIGYRATEQLDLALEVGFSRAETASEFREWEDAEGRPIEQTTRFTRIPLTLTLRGYLWDRGRSIGRFAWVPRGWTPYVGVGGGLVGYEFSQEGDFVDFETRDIFRDRFHSRDEALAAHVLAGTEVSMGPRLLLSGEARYSWASAPMGQDFRGFDEIDLTGVRVTLGLSVRL